MTQRHDDTATRLTPSRSHPRPCRYDLDILTEDAAFAWAEEKKHASESEKKFLNLAQPFLDWLENAESESESDDD